jgi:hypothetical protein
MTESKISACQNHNAPFKMVGKITGFFINTICTRAKNSHVETINSNNKGLFIYFNNGEQG